jgi:hypothetical protein
MPICFHWLLPWLYILWTQDSLVSLEILNIWAAICFMLIYSPACSLFCWLNAYMFDCLLPCLYIFLQTQHSLPEHLSISLFDAEKKTTYLLALCLNSHGWDLWSCYLVAFSTSFLFSTPRKFWVCVKETCVCSAMSLTLPLFISGTLLLVYLTSWW